MSITATYVDYKTFTVSGDQTTDFHSGRRVRADCGTDGYKYGTIDSSSYSSPNTTVVLTEASDDLTSNLTAVDYGIIGKGSTQSMPVHTHNNSEGSGGQINHNDLTNIGTNSHAQIDSHISNLNNPHNVTAAQVGNTTAQWNANQLQGIPVSTTTPIDGQVLTYDSVSNEWQPVTGGGGSATDNISEGDSKVEVVDTGSTAYTRVITNGNEMARFGNNSLGIGCVPDDIANDRLHLRGTDGAFNQLRLECFSSTAGNNTNAFICKRARGTASSPSAVNANDVVFNFQVWVYNGSSWKQKGAYRGKVDPSSTSKGGYDWYVWNGSSWVIAFEALSDKVNVGADLLPRSDNTYDLGSSSNRWQDIWATNDTIQTSDERQKTDIQPVNLGLDFLMELQPVSYKFKDYQVEETVIEGEVLDEAVEKKVIKDVTFHRRHYGLTAQQVKDVLDKLGIDTEDFAGIIYDPETDSWGLRYAEFLAILIKSIQEQQSQINDLTARLEKLEQLGA